jgi:hypothetical protein
MNVGELVVLKKSLDYEIRIKYIFNHIIENKLIGIIIEKRKLYYSQYEGQIYELVISWSDGTFSEMSEKYLEPLNE